MFCMGRDNCKKKTGKSATEYCISNDLQAYNSVQISGLSPNWDLLDGMEMEVSGKKGGTISLAPLLLPQSTKEMLVISLLDSACINILCQNLNSMKLE
jgi:hypothetical protein